MRTLEHKRAVQKAAIPPQKGHKDRETENTKWDNWAEPIWAHEAGSHELTSLMRVQGPRNQAITGCFPQEGSQTWRGGAGTRTQSSARMGNSASRQRIISLLHHCTGPRTNFLQNWYYIQCNLKLSTLGFLFLLLLLFIWAADYKIYVELPRTNNHEHTRYKE